MKFDLILLLFYNVTNMTIAFKYKKRSIYIYIYIYIYMKVPDGGISNMSL